MAGKSERTAAPPWPVTCASAAACGAVAVTGSLPLDPALPVNLRNRSLIYVLMQACGIKIIIDARVHKR
jgi:hypothetical protein